MRRTVICSSCGERVTAPCPRCTKSGKTATPHRLEHARLHTSRRWRLEYRPAVLARDGHVCQAPACKRAGERLPSSQLVADLLVPLAQFRWLLRQAQTLCMWCSGSKDGGRRVYSPTARRRR
jgi:hypothetical protein